MIMRYYKRYYKNLPESEMTVLDGVIDGFTLVFFILLGRVIFNLVIV